MRQDESNLKVHAKKLFGLDTKNIYRVPKGFFDDLEQEIHERIAAKTANRQLRMKWGYEWAAVAAILVIMFFAGLKIFPDKPDMTDTNSGSIFSVPDNGDDYYPIF